VDLSLRLHGVGFRLREPVFSCLAVEHRPLQARMPPAGCLGPRENAACNPESRMRGWVAGGNSVRDREASVASYPRLSPIRTSATCWRRSGRATCAAIHRSVDCVLDGCGIVSSAAVGKVWQLAECSRAVSQVPVSNSRLPSSLPVPYPHAPIATPGFEYIWESS